MKLKKVFIGIGSIVLLCTASFFIAYKVTEQLDKQVFSEQVSSNEETSQNNGKATPEPTDTTSPEPTEPPAPKLSEVTLSSVGDCTIGQDAKFPYSGSFAQVFKNNEQDYSYFFKNVAPIFKEDDITTANLETTFTTSTKKATKEFTFKASPDFVKVLTLGNIDAVNISNNHTRDYLEQGLKDTKDTLNAEGIPYFGEGEKWITEVEGNKFGFLGYKGFTYDNAFLRNLKADITELKNQNCTVIINFHWGVEGSYTPNSTQKYIAHYAIDNGADLIIGHHPHVIQSIEEYKGKMIAYSLGNFVFGGNRNPSDKDTFILQTNFKFEDNKLKSYGIKVIPCSLSSVSNKNDYSPKVLEGSKKTSLLNKLNNLSINLDFKLSDDFYYLDVNN